MNKSEFVNFITEQNASTTKAKAEQVIDIFTSAVIEAIKEGNDISLVGFGSFSISKLAARSGRNPANGKPIQIPAMNQVRFKAGSQLKLACNKK